MKYKNSKKRFAIKAMAMFLLVTFVGQIIHPTAAFALTGGPSQPEITQFQQVSASDMVDLFTGDFSYNIPLFEVPGPNGGYPFNLSYQSAPSMDQEASWVGLGWNVSPGAIVRNMRGLPDDFDGQLIHREIDMKPNITVGVGADLSGELLSADLKKTGTNIGIAGKIYYNNYKGIGYTVQPGISFNLNKGSKHTAGMGFNFSFDTQSGGIGANMDLTLSRTNEENGIKTKKTYQIGIGYNSNSGINTSYSFSRTKEYKALIYKNAGETHGGIMGAGISFAYPSVSPSNGLEMSGGNFTGSVSYGFSPSSSGVDHTYAGFSFFIDATEVANKNESLRSYGYLNYQNKNDESALVDFNREKDYVFKEKSTTNLHSTSLTYDYYMINGQGTGGMFRPYRNEVGYVHEQSRKSGSGGGSLGFNIPTDVKKFGMNVGFNFSDARSGRWDAEQNDLSCDQAYPDNFGYFKGKQHANNMNYEGPYFKLNGNLSVLNQSNFNELGGEEAVRFYINDSLNENIVRKKLINKYGSMSTPQSIGSLDDISLERRPRGQNVTPIYNHVLTSSSGSESMTEMRIRYYDSMSNLASNVGTLSPNANSYSSRSEMSGGTDIRKSHIGGFIVTNPDGNRYIYGLPAYNNETKEHIYTSVPDEYGVCQTHRELDLDGSGAIRYKFVSDINTSQDDKYDITDQFKSITTTPSYTHSHLLSSVLGTDYVDSDTIPGPSDGDYGYWVKFTYVKASSDYIWRSPFTGASYNAGSEASYEDDKINYTSGKKEVWYLATVETKTHVAVFEMSQRMDAKGAKADINNFDPTGGNNHIDTSSIGKQYKLDKIKLFAKQEYLTSGANAMPIQTIHFEYDYSLCPGVPNNSGVQDNNENEFGVQTGVNINQGIANPNFNSGKPVGPGNMPTLYGKLTLKAVYFTYKNDFTGKNHKYKFNYTSNKPYEYVNNKYDRWGTYNWYTNQGQCANANFSYTNQFPQHPFPTVTNLDIGPGTHNFKTSSFADNEERFRKETELAASAWCLNKIELPSGSSINVEYESDDYSHVQHKEATQMFKITSFGYGSDPMHPGSFKNDRLYDETLAPSAFGNGDYDISACKRKRKVFFKLEEPIKQNSLSTPDLYKKIYNDYIHPLKRGNEYQVYINTRVNLLGSVYEDIPSYYNLDIDASTINSTMNSQTSLPLDGSEAVPGMGCNSAELPFGVWQGTEAIYGGTDQYYTHGYVILENTQLDNFDPTLAAKFHPIAINAWYHMKENLPKLLYSNSNEIDPGDEDYERIIRGGSLLSIIPQITAMFNGFPKYCYDNHFAFKVDLNQSWIKLATPDGKKYGGGCRVKKLYMKDDNQWAQDGQTDQIGQVYDYTIEEDSYNDITGQHVVKKISSGVAAYEPIIGGEENALHFAKFYSKDIPLKSSNQSYFEGPYNEAYFPAAQVGYRKVTVSSLPTNLLRTLDADTPPANSSSIKGMRATGLTVNEFYTAKDFPTISQETDLHRQTVVEAIVPIPFIGTITDKQAVGSQGYVIRLNDMHGKPKSVTSFGIKSNGELTDIPTSKVQYLYKSKPIVYEGKSAFELVNEVDVLIDDPNLRGGYILTSYEGPGNPGADGYEALVESKTLGLDYEFFYDMRQSYVKAGQGGLDFNLDVIGFGPFSIGIPLPWPSYSQSYAKVNTIVANKIIQKTGIVDRVVATDGQSTVTTQNLVFDPVTGAPLLTMVNNNFNEPVYNYSIPGRLRYSGMGAAYTNDLLEFSYTASSGFVNIDDVNKTIEVADNIGHTIYTNSAPGGANISLSELLPLLHEGDEFIVEPLTGSQPKVRAYLLTGLNGSQLNCDESGPPEITKLKFYLKTTAPLNYLGTDGSSFKFTLVRSGKRNLLSNNIGSIVSLNTKDDVFKVDPNAANYPSAQALIAHSPLKNRLVQELTSPPATFAYATALAAWLNAILIPRSGGGYQIPLGMYANSVLPPALADKIDYIIIDDSPLPSGGDACLTCPSYMNEYGSFGSGYSIRIKIKMEFGGTCIYQPCIARKFNDYGGVHPIILNSFAAMPEVPCGIAAFYANGHEEGTSSPFHTTGIPGGAPTGTKSYTYTCPAYGCPEFDLAPSFFQLKNILQASAYEPADVWGNLDADMYATGKKGIWRPKINYYYKDNRFQAQDKSVALSIDGVFDGNLVDNEHDRLFYLFNWMVNSNHPMPKEWILNNQITQYNKNGVAIETKDILNIYNATVFDRNTNLPVAIADNTNKREMLAFNFDNNDLQTLIPVTNCAFTGKKSLKITTNQTVLFNFNDDFKLEENKTYLISAWAGGYNMLKSPKLLDQDHPNQMNIKVEFVGATGNSQFKPTGLIYEGVGDSYWRRIEGSFTVPTGATGIKITFMIRDAGYGHQSSFTDDYAYFDDVRLHPAQSIMKTFVYDEVDFKLRAELDENNYPMYYGYDPSGQLTVVKALTENGIKTIKEAYSNTKR